MKPKRTPVTNARLKLSDRSSAVAKLLNRIPSIRRASDLLSARNSPMKQPETP